MRQYARATMAPAVDARVHERMNRRIPDLAIEQGRLDNALATIFREAGQDYVPEWNRLAPYYNPDNVVNVKTHNNTAAEALRMVVESVSAGQPMNTYIADGSLVRITHADAGGPGPVLRIYDVRDIGERLRRSGFSWEWSPPRPLNGFGNGGLMISGVNYLSAHESQSRVEEFIRLVATSDGNELRDNGGMGQVVIIADRLAVLVSPKGHDRVQAHLELLRKWLK